MEGMQTLFQVGIHRLTENSTKLIEGVLDEIIDDAMDIVENKEVLARALFRCRAGTYKYRTTVSPKCQTSKSIWVPTLLQVKVGKSAAKHF